MVESRGLVSFELPGEGAAESELEISVKNSIINGSVQLFIAGVTSPIVYELYERIANSPNTNFWNYVGLVTASALALSSYGFGISNLRRAVRSINN